MCTFEKKREPIYGADPVKALKIIWMNLDFMCGKRLKAVLAQTESVMEKWGEMIVSAETKRKLDRISTRLSIVFYALKENVWS